VLARNVLSVSNKTVRASIEADDLRIVQAIVDELRSERFKIRVAGGELIARFADERKLTSHERRLLQKLNNYYKMYPAQIQQLIAASGRAPAA